MALLSWLTIFGTQLSSFHLSRLTMDGINVKNCIKLYCYADACCLCVSETTFCLFYLGEYHPWLSRTKIIKLPFIFESCGHDFEREKKLELIS